MSVTVQRLGTIGPILCARMARSAIGSMTTGHTLIAVRDKMRETPKVGDLVQLRGSYFNNATGVIMRRIYSWSAMADAYVVQVDDNVTHHAPLERIEILSKSQP
jgi:hypothetical protein